MSVQAAIEIVTKAHADQWREGEAPLPYVTHVMEVLLNVRYIGGITDPEILCAAVLHDTVEAGSLSLNQIERAFGKRVRSLVAELTRTEPTEQQTSDLTAEQIWQLRAGMLVDEIAKMSPDAQTIKLADRLSNVRDACRNKKGKKLARYKLQTKRILEAVPKSVNKALWNAIDRDIRV